MIPKLPIGPELSVGITSTGISTERQNYSLICTINGVGSLNVIYQWHKDGNITIVSNSSTLNFTPLTQSDDGTYTCTVTITSQLLNNTHTAMNETVVIVGRKYSKLTSISYSQPLRIK